jgi:hypothetical protein
MHTRWDLSALWLVLESVVFSTASAGTAPLPRTISNEQNCCKYIDHLRKNWAAKQNVGSPFFVQKLGQGPAKRFWASPFSRGT